MCPKIFHSTRHLVGLLLRTAYPILLSIFFVWNPLARNQSTSSSACLGPFAKWSTISASPRILLGRRIIRRSPSKSAGWMPFNSAIHSSWDSFFWPPTSLSCALSKYASSHSLSLIHVASCHHFWCARNTVGASVLVATRSSRYWKLPLKSPLAFIATTEPSPASQHKGVFNRSGEVAHGFSLMLLRRKAFFHDGRFLIRNHALHQVFPDPLPSRHQSLSTYNPDPIKGESPTRPGFFFIKSPSSLRSWWLYLQTRLIPPYRPYHVQCIRRELFAFNSLQSIASELHGMSFLQNDEPRKAAAPPN